MPVVALLAPKVEGTENEICTLSEITVIPNQLIDYIQGRVPTFQLRYSKTAGHPYFANVCPRCHSIFGDFHLHSEPGAPFFPTDAGEAASLYLTEIPLSSPISVQASVGMGAGELILEHAKRIP